MSWGQYTSGAEGSGASEIGENKFTEPAVPRLCALPHDSSLCLPTVALERLDSAPFGFSQKIPCPWASVSHVHFPGDTSGTHCGNNDGDL